MMTRPLRRFGRDQRGIAAVEMAMVLGIFAVGFMNATDVGRYAYQTSQVNAAAQAGAQAALNACDMNHTPATVNCADLNSAVTTAIQTTTLGSQVTIDGGISEGWYCLDATGKLQLAGSVMAKPTDCSGIASPAANASPVLYLQVPVTFPFQPLFPGLTLAKTFTSTIKRTAWMRMA
jgi:Flp pilus assembly protein TadG